MFESITSAVSSWFSNDEDVAAPAAPAASVASAPAVTSTAVEAPPPGPARAIATTAPGAGEETATVTATATATEASQPGTPTEARQPDPAAMRQAAADLFTAMDGMGTNEDAIHSALRGRSAAEIEAIRAAYADHYPGRTLDGDLEDELSGDELEAARTAMTADPVTSAAASLVNAASGLGTDEDTIMRTLEGITDPAQRAAVAAEYERRTGESLNDMLGSELSDSDLDVANALAVGDRAGANAARLDEAMNGTFLGMDFGTNEDGVYSAIESARTPEERAALVDAYQRRTGRTLDTDLNSELSGAELDVATSLAAGDAAGAAAARVAVAADGWGTDENAIYAQLANVPQERRAALIAQYNERYGAAAGGLNFDDMLADEMGDMDAERARQLAANGRMDPVFAMQYAMDGIGTDEAMIREQLAGRTAAEIDAFRAEYRTRYGRDLDADIGGENSGRDGFEIGQLLLGEPQTPEERLARSNAAYDFERGSGSTWLGRNLTDAFSDSGHYLDLQHQRMNEIGERMAAGEATPEDLERLGTLSDYQRQDVTSYQAARDTATNAAAMAGTAVVGTAVSILTAGAASPAVVAALAALAGGAAGMAIRVGMQGDSLSQEDIAIEALTTLASAATAGALQGGAAQALFRGIAGVAEGAAPTLAQQVAIQAMQGAIGGAANGAVGGALDEQNYQGDFGDWLAGMGRSTGMGALQGGVSGAVTGGVKGAMGDAPAGMDPRVWAGITGGVGGGMGGLAQSAVDPATYEGRWEDIAMRFGNSAITNALQEAAEGVNDAATDMNRPHPSSSSEPHLSTGEPHATTGEPHATTGAEPHATTGDPHASVDADAPARPIGSDEGVPAEQVNPAVVREAHGEMADMIDNMRAAGIDMPEAGESTIGRDHPDRRAMPVEDLNAVIDSIPGAQGRTVVPDGTSPMPPGAITASQAQRLIDMTDLLANTPTGQAALAQLDGNVANLTQDGSVGSFRQGGRINIDPATGLPAAASTLAHEAHHAATYDTDVTPLLATGTRDEYIQASLRNEAEAQAAALEVHRELGPLSPTGGADQYGHGPYHAAYNAEAARLQAAHPDMSPADIAAAAREAGTQALHNTFGTAVPSTSVMTDARGRPMFDPLTGQPILVPGAPANYGELYGQGYDANAHLRPPGGIVAGGGAGVAPPAGGGGGAVASTEPRGVFGRMWDGITGFFGGGTNASPAALPGDDSTTGQVSPAPLSPEALAAMRAEHDAFLESPEFEAGTRPRGAEGAPTAGVEVWGQPSDMNGKIQPGHVAATSVSDPSAHSSFGPASALTVELRGMASEANNLAPLGRSLDRLGTGLPPLEGARLQPVTMRQGEHYPNPSADPFHTPDKIEFSHVFDPDFIDPNRFAEVTRARQDDDMILADPRMLDASEATARREASQYQLMTVPMDQVDQPEGGPRRVGRDANFDPETLGRVTTTTDATGAERTVAPAQNCATDLMFTLHEMGVISSEDFQVLGGDEHGVFMPENDVTPQALYQLLRWREYQAAMLRQRNSSG